MARLYEAEKVQPIDLDALLARMDDMPAGLDDGAVQEESAYLLQRFAANGNLIRRHIDERGGLEAARGTFVPPQTFALGRGRRFGVRANVWQKLGPTPYRDHEAVLYAYGLAHNHDFAFLTVGHFGPGYETELFEVAPEETTRPAGSAVHLTKPRRVQLREGAVLNFAAYRDLHTQFQPEALSITINLIQLDKPRGYEQAFFDTDGSTLIGTAADSEVGRIMTAIEVAGLFADAETLDLLADLARGSDVARVRIAARERLDMVQTTRTMVEALS